MNPMDNMPSDISYNLRLFLLVMDVSRKELAEAIGVTPQTVSCWCIGAKTPTVTALLKVAHFLGVTLDALCDSSLKEEVDMVISRRIIAKGDNDVQS